jgi:hypothetical protein
MLYGEIPLHADDDEDENGCRVAKRVNEMIGFAHERAPDPTAKREKERNVGVKLTIHLTFVSINANLKLPTELISLKLLLWPSGNFRQSNLLTS